MINDAQAATHTYSGTELELFRTAVNWKGYYNGFLAAHIAGSVLEVGAGIGGTTRALATSRHARWTCLEPDSALAAQIEKIKSTFPVPCQVRQGSLSTLGGSEKFDTILYIDVLEHIEADAKELELARDHLNAGGKIVVLSPAHQFLFSPFDQAVGHHRRYNLGSLKKVAPPGLKQEALFYLDSMGFFLSLGNRMLLKQSAPSRPQIEFWDRYVIPISRLVDPLLRYRFGKTVIGVWSKGA
ncbi:MAG: class I SAM-dependent methyltransferase [Deltaproteobacteria bacterium]|nr:class I SAM-dependent methyltransferase [Deltaproteobacteria bacterium]